jgi:hypothetical protein
MSHMDVGLQVLVTSSRRRPAIVAGADLPFGVPNPLDIAKKKIGEYIDEAEKKAIEKLQAAAAKAAQGAIPGLEAALSRQKAAAIAEAKEAVFPWVVGGLILSALGFGTTVYLATRKK